MNSFVRRKIIQKIIDELDQRVAKSRGQTASGHHTDLFPNGTSKEWVCFSDGSRVRYPQSHEEYLETCIDLIESVQTEAEFLAMIKSLKTKLTVQKT